MVCSLVRAGVGRGRSPRAPAGSPCQTCASGAPRRLSHRGIPGRRPGLRLPGDRGHHGHTDRDRDVAASPCPPSAPRRPPGSRSQRPSGREAAGKEDRRYAGQSRAQRAGPVMAARPDILRAVARPARTSALARPAGLAWPRLPAWAELATLGAGYAAYALVRLAPYAARRAERRLHLTVEPYLNHLAGA